MVKHLLNMQECLLDMKKILDDINQEFFLTCGTLLGVVREKNFILHDQDIDIGIFLKNYKKDLFQYIINSGKFKNYRIISRNKQIYELSFIHNNDIPIDIFIHFPYKNNLFYCTSVGGLCNKKKDR